MNPPISDEYRSLLRYGFASLDPSRCLNRDQDHTDEWWREIEIRAERDGLLVQRTYAWEPLTMLRAPALELLAPDGSSYRAASDADRIRRMRRDWGNSLSIARSRL
jgi:hypothetical protein